MRADTVEKWLRTRPEIRVGFQRVENGNQRSPVFIVSLWKKESEQRRGAVVQQEGPGVQQKRRRERRTRLTGCRVPSAEVLLCGVPWGLHLPAELTESLLRVWKGERMEARKGESGEKEGLCLIT